MNGKIMINAQDKKI